MLSIQLPYTYMAKMRERERAQQLRKHGESIGIIARKLQVSKSTVSYWCRGIVLNDAQIDALAHHQKTAGAAALFRAAEKKRQERQVDISTQSKVGGQDVGSLNRRDLFMLGLGLYWGEGYKHGNDELGFTNSDPDMVLVYLQWLKNVYGVQKQRVTLRVSINALHRHREKSIVSYWSRVTGIPQKQFTKTSFISTAAQKHYANPNKHYGTLRIKVRGGTQLRRRILGSIAAVKTDASETT